MLSMTILYKFRTNSDQIQNATIADDGCVYDEFGVPLKIQQMSTLTHDVRHCFSK